MVESILIIPLCGVGKRFKISGYKKHKSLLDIETELISYKKIMSSFGQTEIRPTVHLKIQIGTEIWSTEITLAQRAKLTYPMLIGRNTLNKKHIIHSHRSYLAGTHSV